MPGLLGLEYYEFGTLRIWQLPPTMNFLLKLINMHKSTMISRPTNDISTGLLNYKSVLPSRFRGTLVVLDKRNIDADTLYGENGKYFWIELKFPPVYKLDLTGVTSEEQYVNSVLRKNQRRNYKKRMETWKSQNSLFFEYRGLSPNDSDLLVRLWELYHMNGERNGLVLLSKSDFFSILVQHKCLRMLLVRDSTLNNQVISFCICFQANNTLISTWCGSDYNHPLVLSHSVYMMTQYEAIRIAIADVNIDMVDFGSLHKTMKTSFGAKPHEVAGYLRFKNWMGRQIAKFLLNNSMMESLNNQGVLCDP